MEVPGTDSKMSNYAPWLIRFSEEGKQPKKPSTLARGG